MSSNTYDKPFKTYDEMLDLLESRNIIISDRTFAIQTLSNFSYYSLVNGYKNTFLTLPGTDEFAKGTRFEDLYFLNIIESDLNNIIFKYILNIEKSLKSKISYRISEKYGVYTDITSLHSSNYNDYFHPSHYSNSSNTRMNVIHKLKECIVNSKDSNVIKHYIRVRNHLPPWIATNVIPFGLMINWYRIFRDDDKQNICNSFIPDQSMGIVKNKEFLIKSFDLIKSYRNIIAHGNRTLALSRLPKLPKEQTVKLAINLLSENEYNCGLGQNDTYSVFIVILILMNDMLLLRDFYFDCYVFFHKHKDYTFNTKTLNEVFGLPDDTLKRIEEYLSIKFL